MELQKNANYFGVFFDKSFNNIYNRKQLDTHILYYDELLVGWRNHALGHRSWVMVILTLVWRNYKENEKILNALMN